MPDYIENVGDARERLIEELQAKRCLRHGAIEWISLVGILVLVTLASLWFTRPLACISGPRRPSQHTLFHNLKLTIGEGEKATSTEMVLLADNPCIRLIRNFLTGEEVAHLLANYKHLLAPSMVAENGVDAYSQDRTSSTGYLPAGGDKDDSILLDIEKKVVLLSGIPLEFWETFQMTHYVEGQQYKPHYDWFNDSENNRSATIFIYLNTVSKEHGGATEFPRLNLSVQPQLGSAIIWFNCAARGNSVQCDIATEHAGLPPNSGEKIGLNCWSRTLPFRT